MQRMNRKEVLFYLGWFFFSISVIFELTDLVGNYRILQLTFKLIRYIGYVFCCLKIFEELIEKKKIYLIFLMFAIFGISCIKSTNKTMILYSLTLIAAMNINEKRIMKISLLIQGLVLFFTVSLSQIGILQDYLFVRNEEHYRHALGFMWTTTAPILFFFFMLIFFYLKKDAVKIYIILLLECINGWLYAMTDSRMIFMLSSVFLFFMIIQKLNPNRWKWICKFSTIYKFLPEIICGMSLLTFLFFDEQKIFWIQINTILSNRLRLGVSAIKEYGFSLFGKNIEWIGFTTKTPTIETAIGYNYVDSSYLQLSLNYGIVFTIVILIIYSVVIYKAVKKRDYYLVSIVIAILVFSITEPRLMNLAFNPFPLLAFCKLEEG